MSTQTPQRGDRHAVCDSCGRKSWATREFGKVCGMPQPDGMACAGYLIVPHPDDESIPDAPTGLPFSFAMDWPNLMFRCNHCPYVCSFFTKDLGEALPALQQHHDGAHGHQSTAEVVTLCGSMRFKDLMLTVAEQETARGRIVLMPFSVVAQSEQGGEFKAMLDRLHRAKIDLSDSIIVVTDESGYFGESTRGEIAYAEAHGKPVRYRNARVATPAAQPAAELCSCSSTTVVRIHGKGTYCGDDQHERLAAALDVQLAQDILKHGEPDVEKAAAAVLDALRNEPVPRAQPATVDDTTLRERAAQAAMVEWHKHAVLCKHGQVVPFGDIVDAVLSVVAPVLAELRAERDSGQRRRERLRSVLLRGATELRQTRERARQAELELANARDELAALRAQLANSVVLPDNWREQLAPEEVSETFECVADLIESWRPATEPAKAPCGCFRCQEPTFPRLIADDPDTKYQPHMIVCAGCGNKRCPHATDHRNACTGSNASGQVGSNYGPLTEVPTEGGTHA